MLSVRQLSFSYGSHKALIDFDLEMRPGEVLGLLGPNGAGKSTLMSLICGLLKPSTGMIRIGEGLDPSDPASRAILGLAPQETALYEDLSARENLGFFAGLQGLAGSELKDRVNFGLGFAGLVDRADDRVSTFSGGMKRRLNLATALVHNPPLLLLDEPTVGVDPQSRNALLEAVGQLKQEGRAILYATHYMEEAARICDRVAIVDHGKLLALGTVPDLIRDHGGEAVLDVRIKGEPFRETCSDPVAALNRLAEKGPLESLQLAPPDLERVFLNLTGRQLRDG